MNFFTKLFSGGSDKNELSIIDGKAKLYLQKSKKGKKFTFKIDMNITCKKILENIMDENKDSGLDKKGVFLITDSNNNSEIILSQDDKPYQYLIGSTNLFCYLRANELNSNKRKDSSNKTQNKDKTIETLISGDVFRWSEKKKHFCKKKAVLTENEFRIISSKKGFNVQINTVIKYNGSKVNRPPSLSNQKVFLSEPFLIEIIYNPENISLILKFKRQGDYDHWYKALGDAITKRKEKQIDMEYTESIENFSGTIGISEQAIMTNCFDLSAILTMKKARNIIYKLLDNKPISDIFENIIEYKYLCKKYNFIEAWSKIKLILYQVTVTNANITTDEPNDLYNKVVTKENIAEANKLCKEIEVVISENIKGSSNPEELLKEKLNNILKISIFDEIFNKIVDYYISDIYNNHFYNSNNNYSSISNQIKYLIATHLFSTYYNKLTYNYLGNEKTLSK